METQGPRAAAAGRSEGVKPLAFLSREALAALERILAKGERVEIIPTKDGVRIFEVRRREIKSPAAERRSGRTESGSTG